MLLRVLCDENVSGSTFAVLKEWGVDVRRVAPSTPDPNIAAQAKRERRIIVTHDSDFANILAYPPQNFFGIIRIKIDPAFNAIVIPALQRVFNAFTTPEDFRGKLIIAEAETFRAWERDEDFLKRLEEKRTR